MSLTALSLGVAPFVSAGFTEQNVHPPVAGGRIPFLLRLNTILTMWMDHIPFIHRLSMDIGVAPLWQL